MQVIPVLLLVLIIGGLAFIIFRLSQSAPAKDDLTRLTIEAEQKDRLIEELSAKAAQTDDLLLQKTRLGADLENERKNAQEKLQLLQNTEARLKTEFENLANRIFEEKGKTFSTQSKEKLDGLLTPFRDQIEAFRKRVDEVHRDDTESMGRLLTQVRQLQELNNRVSVEANNLADAIKGDAKTQGTWGELIIERIFEASGLERGREYDVQAGMRTEDGRLQKPDFLVYLPGNKVIIVDSKMSLTAYERYSSATVEIEKQMALSEHLLSVRKHIEELRAKAYEDLLGNRTLDFVILCIPLEPAYQLALGQDRNLIYDLAKGAVVITGPSTLMLTLKLIAQIWRRENENRNVELIADRAGRLYDQVVLVVESMLDAQKKLVGVRDSFDTAMKRLKEGNGNLVGRIEEIRKLGAKTRKQLPPEIVDKSEETES
jgi:DNA recombination protein RmuC